MPTARTAGRRLPAQPLLCARLWPYLAARCRAPGRWVGRTQMLGSGRGRGQGHTPRCQGSTAGACRAHPQLPPPCTPLRLLGRCRAVVGGLVWRALPMWTPLNAPSLQPSTPCRQRRCWRPQEHPHLLATGAWLGDEHLWEGLPWAGDDVQRRGPRCLAGTQVQVMPWPPSSSPLVTALPSHGRTM